MAILNDFMCKMLADINMLCSFTTTNDSIGLEKLNGKKFSEHQKCPSCMIGKSQLNDKPESIKRTEKPLRIAKVNFDLISSSVTSIEGYNYCAVLT